MLFPVALAGSNPRTIRIDNYHLHCSAEAVTNMPLENLLAEHKAAMPNKKQKPSMETFTYTATLSALLRKHMAEGGNNPLLETRDEMIAAGVPVKAACMGKKSLRSRSDWQHTRPDVLWKNRVWGHWRRQNREASKEEAAAEFRRLSMQWVAMTQAERQHAVATLGNSAENDPHAGSPDIEDIEADATKSQQWLTGDKFWPVSPSILEMFVGSGRSVVTRSNVERPKAAERFFVKDENLIPTSMCFIHRYSCSEKHPGLCISKDALIYKDALDMGRHFEKWFSREHVGRCFRFLVRCGDERHTACAMLANVRARRPRAQQTHIFLEMDSDDDWSSVSFGSTSDRGERMAFESVWGMSKLFLDIAATEVTVQEIFTERCLRDAENDPSVLKVLSFARRVQLWPALDAGAAKPPREVDPLRALIDRPRKIALRNRSYGGIRGHVARPVGGAVPEIAEHPEVFVRIGNGDDDHEGSFSSSDNEAPEPPDRARRVEAAVGGFDGPVAADEDVADEGDMESEALDEDDYQSVASNEIGDLELPELVPGWRGRRVGIGPAYEQGVVPCMLDGAVTRGVIKINIAACSLDAHCRACKLKVNRSFNPKWRRGRGEERTEVGPQGRPLGTLIALLQVHCTGDIEAHRQQLSALSFDDRLAAREWGLSVPSLALLFEKERPKRLDEPSEEPDDIP